MTEQLDCVVVGAGVVGLAVARALARAGREVVVLEAEESFGMHASSRNSEVIHAGIYYPPGSLKAETCLAGKPRLYAYCREHGIDHRRLGKLIVATAPEQESKLRAIQVNALACGLEDLVWLGADEARLEAPAVHCHAALWSPSTGIVDSHGVMRRMLADTQELGGAIAYATPVLSGSVGDEGITLKTPDLAVRCNVLVNAAGLGAQAVARSLSGFDPRHVPTRYMAKGTYFTLPGRSPFDCLVYPVPDTASLGIHVTLDLGGMARFGPDQEWIEQIDYAVDASRAEAFEAAVRRYYPELPSGALQPGYAGIRCKVQAPGEPMADFVLQGPRDHGVPGLLHAFGIESPGLTASLALADEILARLGIEPVA